MMHLFFSRTTFIFVSVVALLTAASSSAPALAQSGDPVGTLIYFEGSVSVTGSSTPWTTPAIDEALTASQKIRTGSGARAEIEWVSGETTVMGPDDVRSVGDLFQASQKQASGESRSLLQGFVDMFSEDEAASQSEAGGVRRSEADDGMPTGDLYWKTFDTVDYGDAAQLYRSGNYAKAAPQLYLFLQQNPTHSKAKTALFALGHCYVELNNPAQAQATFQRLIDEYPNDPLSTRARKVVEGL